MALNGQTVVLSREVGEGTLTARVIGQQVTMSETVEFTEAERVGEGLFWRRYRVELTLQGPYGTGEEPWSEVTGTIWGEASNGMRSLIRFQADGKVTGWVQDAQGHSLATVDGGLFSDVTLRYNDGTEESLIGPIDWGR
jgi:hypothetical protein